MSFSVLYVGGAFLIIAAVGLIVYVLRGNERRWPADAFQWTAIGLSGLVIVLCVVMLLLAASVQRSGGLPLSDAGAANVRAEEMDAALPDFQFRKVSDRSETSLSDLSGNVVLVNIWATWCAPCRFEMPELNRLQADYREEGLVVLNLSDEDPADLLTYQNELGLQTLSAYVDPADVPEPLRRNFAVRPTSFVIDRQGILRESVLGALDYEGFEEMLLPYLADPANV